MSDTVATSAIPAETPQPDHAAAKREQVIVSALRLRQFKTSFSGQVGPASMILLAFLKIFRIDIPAQSDFPCATTLAPFQTTEAEVPPKALEAMKPMIAALEQQGFVEPVWHWLPSAMAIADTVVVTMRHASGQIIGRVTSHLMRVKAQPIAFVQLFSEVADGRLLLTWPRGFELAKPEDWTIQKIGKGPIGGMFEAHRQKLVAMAGAKPVVVFPTAESMHEFIERRQKQLMELQAQRGVCVTLKPAERQRLAKRLEVAQTARNVSGAHADVLSEIARLQESTTNWGTTIFILVLSLVAFIAAGMSKDKWDSKFLIVLLIVLFVHELGHYVAMRLSGYRNLKMFFIPFLGAAVSGQSYNVAGWKKTIVSLMGPVPGIMLAIPLGIVGVFLGYQTLTMFALMSLIINALNLLPVLPLDGGWVMHHVLFSRNVYLEVMFRIVAIGALLLASIGFSDKLLMYIAIATAVQIPFAFMQARIVSKLRKGNFRPVSHDDQTIPPETAVPIIEQVRATFPKNLSTRAAAQHTIAVFDRLNSTPPGWVASIFFLILHGGTFIFACFCALAFALGMHGGFEGIANVGRTFRTLAAMQRAGVLTEAVSPETVNVVSPPGKAIPPLMLCANYKSHKAAMDAAQRLRSLAPTDAGCLVFGQTLMISVAKDDDAVRELLFAAMSESGKDVQVRRPDQPCSLTLQFELPSKTEEHPAVKELSAFLAGPHRDRDYAPWDPSDPRDPEAKAKSQRTLAIYSSILDPKEDLDRQAAELFSEEYQAASRKGDRAALKRLMEAQEAKRKQATLNRLGKLAKDNPDHAPLITAVRDAVAKSGDTALFTDLPKLAEPYLQLMPKDTPNPMGVSHGSAGAYERTISLNLTLISPPHSLPAITRWLEQRGLANGKYQFYIYPSGGHEPFEDE